MIDHALITLAILLYTGTWLYVGYQFGADEGRRDKFNQGRDAQT
jgi:hypothetical protein